MLCVSVLLYIGRENGLKEDYIKWITYIFPVYRSEDFLVGCICGYLFLTEQEKLKRYNTTFFEFVIIVIITMQIIAYNSNRIDSVIAFSLFWIITSSLIVFLFALEKGRISCCLTKSKVLLWIGNVSGEAFLIHQIIIKTVEHFVLLKALVFIIAFPLTLFFTYMWRKLFVYKTKLFIKND